MKLFISPTIEQSPYGIRRVIEALHRYLPEHGIEIVENPETADVINCHALAFVDIPNKPLVYSSHGFHWNELRWPTQLLDANQYMADIMARADEITVTSEWVGHAVTRGMQRKPYVVYHGVDTDEWKPPATHSNFVLWNKARADVVSNPNDLNKVAAMLPDIGFVTTIGNPAENVQVIGTIPHEQMKQAVSQAGVYLATARETFGIGTLEALACGVPVVGWDWGGQREIIEHGINGYLAKPGDYNALAEYIKLAMNDQEMRVKARDTAVDKWGWQQRIKQYADIFHGVYHRSITKTPVVSVIITNYNLAKYLPDCLQSVQEQTLDDFECILVDDSSTDDSYHVALPFMRDVRFRYTCTPNNLGLSGARNFGFKQATGKYILYLDADDKLAPTALKTLSDALENDPFLSIVYGHLDLINEDGSYRGRGDWPFEQFDWHGQLAHINQMPYCTMMRRRVLENSGGYRLRDWRAEDASFWCKVTSLGERAKKVTEDSLLLYRVRGDSKGATERAKGYDDGDWTSWYPWRIGANNAREGFTMVQSGKQPHWASVPFGAQGKTPKHCWPVWSHHDPIVTVIIPVGAKHVPYLFDSLDSVQGQTFPFWECVVVNDTGKPLDIDYAPWVRVVDNGTHNIADSRNKGIEAARSPLVLFLDCDDLLTPTALYDMLVEFVKYNGSRYIYTDWWGILPGEAPKQQSSREYERNGEGLHPISTLIPKEWCQAVGGFDNQVKGWEDWEFCIKLQVNGYCGARLPKNLLVYRLHSGERREQSLADAKITLPVLDERYGKYYNGELQMPGCCGGNGDVILETKRKLGLFTDETAEGSVSGKPQVNNGMVRIEFIGQSQGAIDYRRVSGVELSRSYRLGNNDLERYADATEKDAQLLVKAGICRYVRYESIDLSQAAVPQFVIPEPEQNDILPEIAQFTQQIQAKLHDAIEQIPPDMIQGGIEDITGGMSVKELQSFVIGKSANELKQLLAQEQAGKNRKGAIALLNDLIADSERVA